MDFVVPLFALSGGGAVAWVVSRSLARLQESRAACSALQLQLVNVREELRVEAERRASAEASLAAEKRAQSQISDAFKALSAEALHSNNQAFLDLANATLSRFQEGAKVDLEGKQKAIDETLKPLKESLEKVDQKIHLLETDRKSAYDLLTHRVKELVVTQGQLQTETANLVRALRAPHTRGRWGELQLKRVVEIAGMLDRCDFRE